MSRALRLVFAISLAHAAACSAFGSAEPEGTGGSDAGSSDRDASSTSSEASIPSPSPSPSGSGSPEGGTDVKTLNGDFELGCAGWYASQGSADPDTGGIARNGTGACRICAAQANGVAELQQTTNVTVPAGSLFAAEIWYRADPTEAASAAPFAVLYSIEGGFSTEDGSRSSGPAPTTEWSKVTALLPTTKAASSLLFVLSFEQSAGKCIIVDDARIVRTP